MGPETTHQITGFEYPTEPLKVKYQFLLNFYNRHNQPKKNFSEETPLRTPVINGNSEKILGERSSISVYSVLNYVLEKT